MSEVEAKFLDTMDKIQSELFPSKEITLRYLYRGQPNNNELIPSSLRSNCNGTPIIKKYVNMFKKNNRDIQKLEALNNNEESLHNYIEFRIINRFLYIIDDLGYQLPGETNDFRKNLKYLRGNSISNIVCVFKKFPDFADDLSWFSIFALAQHFGLPTKLLDWTSYSLIALYYAAIGSFEKNTDHMYIYKLDTEPRINEEEYAKYRQKLIVHPIQGSLNPNLSAQKGKLTYFDASSINEHKEGYEKHFSEYLTIYQIPKKLRTPLLEVLRAYYISKDTLYPNLQSVAGSINTDFHTDIDTLNSL